MTSGRDVRTQAGGTRLHHTYHVAVGSRSSVRKAGAMEIFFQAEGEGVIWILPSWEALRTPKPEAKPGAHCLQSLH